MNKQDVISRQAVVDSVNKALSDYTGDSIITYASLVLDYIKALPSVQPQTEPCGKDINVTTTDAISRQAAIDAVRGSVWAQNHIKNLPSVTPQKVGKWIKTRIRISSGDFTGGVKCSKCGYETVVDDFKYCPYCGNPKKEG